MTRRHGDAETRRTLLNILTFSRSHLWPRFSWSFAGQAFPLATSVLLASLAFTHPGEADCITAPAGIACPRSSTSQRSEAMIRGSIYAVVIVIAGGLLLAGCAESTGGVMQVEQTAKVNTLGVRMLAYGKYQDAGWEHLPDHRRALRRDPRARARRGRRPRRQQARRPQADRDHAHRQDRPVQAGVRCGARRPARRSASRWACSTCSCRPRATGQRRLRLRPASAGRRDRRQNNGQHRPGNAP